MNIMYVLFMMVLLINKLPSSSCTNDVLTLCSDSKDIYYDNYTSTTSQNCGCQKADMCIRKCCQRGFILRTPDSPLGDLLCERHLSDDFSVPVYDGTRRVRTETQNFVIGTLTCNKADLWYFQADKNDPELNFYVQENGSVYLPYHKVTYTNKRYCIDEQGNLTIYYCFTNTLQDSKVSVETLIHVTAKLISLPFLLITGLVYALLRHRNLHRNAIMVHVLALFFGNGSLAVGQYSVIHDDTLCFSLGCFILFFMMLSVFWMNVLCIDIWLPFGCLRRLYVKENTKKKIGTAASIYACSLPSLIVLFVILVNTYGDPNAKHHPGIGVESCFLKNGLPIVMYYFGPIVVLILINLVLFVMTAVNMRKIRKEAKSVDNSKSKKLSNKEEKFKLYWKLLFVMGLNPVVNTYIVQLISWSLGNNISHDIVVYIWYFKDISHASYGILVFLFFVCQKKIWMELKRRFPCICKPGELDSPISVATSNSISVKENSTPAMQLTEIQPKSTDAP